MFHKKIKLGLHFCLCKPLWERDQWFIRSRRNIGAFFLTSSTTSFSGGDGSLSSNYFPFSLGSTTCLPVLVVTIFICASGFCSGCLRNDPRGMKVESCCYATWEIWVYNILLWVSIFTTLVVSYLSTSLLWRFWFLKSSFWRVCVIMKFSIKSSKLDFLRAIPIASETSVVP